MLYTIVDKNSGLLSNEKIRAYGLALFFFSHILAEILREDALGKEILSNPRDIITTNKDIFISALTRVWELITPDINCDLEEYATANDNFFDYKNVFKNAQFVHTMTGKIKSDYIRLTRRNAADSFSSVYNHFAELDRAIRQSST